MRKIVLLLLLVGIALAYPPDVRAERAQGRMSAAPVVAKEAAADKTAPEITVTQPDVQRSLKVKQAGQSLTVVGKARDVSGVASVTVNNQPAALDENGNFSADILLRVGDNQIAVTAMDVYKNTRTEKFTVIREAGKVVEAKPEAVAAGVGGRSLALIIGINAYHQNIGPLKTAVADARAVGAILQSDYGFENTVILDGKATRAAILKELSRLKATLNPQDRLLIYYAGHGYYDKDTGTSYWLPVDADKDEITNYIESRTITNELRRSQARQILVVADSCYSGTMDRAFTPGLEGRGTRENHIRKMMEKPSRVLIASGGNEPVSDSGGKGHSIFADVFIRALKNPEQDVFTAEELLVGKIKESVGGRADQTPEYKVLRNSGHDGGDFVFVRKK